MRMQAWPVVVVVLISASFHGCLASRAVTAAIESIPTKRGWIELIEASPDSIKLTLALKYPVSVDRRHSIEFDPKLEGCESVRVLAHTAVENFYLVPANRKRLDFHPRESKLSDSDSHKWKTGEIVDECTAAVLLSATKNELTVTIENSDELLKNAVSVPSPKNVLLLAAVLPFAVVIDVLTLPVQLPVVYLAHCFETLDCEIGDAKGWGKSK